MTKQQYVSYLLETSARVSPLIRDIIKAGTGHDSKLYAAVMVMAQERLGKPMVRPGLVRGVYEVCGGEDWQQVLHVCAAFEMLNISSYQANTIFDGKRGVATDADRNSQLIAAMICRELAWEVLRGRAWTEEWFTRLADWLSEVNHNIYLAQHWDLNLLTFDRLPMYRNEAMYRQEYLKRCEMGSGIFAGVCAAAGAAVAGANAEVRTTARRFGERYGTILQIINDIGDCVPLKMLPDEGRSYQEQFSDLRNKRLTYPLYCLLASEAPEVPQALRWIAEEGPLSAAADNQLGRMLLRNGCFEAPRRLIRQQLLQARQALHDLPDTPARATLAIMLSIGTSNKYFTGLRLLAMEEPEGPASAGG